MSWQGSGRAWGIKMVAKPGPAQSRRSHPLRLLLGRVAAWWIVCVLLASTSGPARASARFPEGDGAQSSTSLPRVPEPMLFDLVRPLGAKRGELEVNVLAEQPLRAGRTKWAPEVEYAVADGLALELELPMESGRLVEYKAAIQGTFGAFGDGTRVHGWQVIGRRDRESARFGADLLYLVGAELRDGWSAFGMAGFRRTAERDDALVGLVNASLFRDLSQRVTLGLETNAELRAGRLRVRVLPQAHLDLSTRITLQVGATSYVRRRDQSTETGLVGRLIHAW
jgi:hypothetical protein